MTNDPRASLASGSPLDDSDIAALVRDAADAWQMPPVTLDRRRWAELVRSRSRGRHGLGGGAFRRLGNAVALAVALAVVAAVAGVALTRLRSQDAASVRNVPAKETSSPSVVPPGPIAPDQFLVQLESGYAMVDLAKGTIGRGLVVGGYGSLVRQLDDGTLVCLCVSSAGVSGGTASYSVDWRTLDANGDTLTSSTVGTFTGTPDPRGGAQDAFENATVELSPGDGTTVYVGWSTREHPVWHSGLVAVDIATGSILQRLDLPDRSDGPDAAPAVVIGPSVVGAAGGDRVLINRGWYSYAPPRSSATSYQPGFDAFLAESRSGTLAAPQPFDALAGCGDYVNDAGSLDGGRWWAACSSNSGPHLRRFATNDVPLDDTAVPESNATIAVNRDGTAVFAWDPIALRLTKVDLATARTTVGTGSAATTDLLAQIGNWLTPPAAAKEWVMPSFAVSPDGSRVYALGITAPAQDASTSSTGLYVFDAASMDLLAHWPAAADYESIATSADGSLIFLAAGPATGVQPPGASVTVLDSATGDARATIGGLGFQRFFFTDPQQP